MPTQSDYESHRDCGHIPYRAWCKHRVEGRGRDFGHHRSLGAEKQVSTVAFDYMFITDKGVFMRNELPGDFEVDPLSVAHDLVGGNGSSPAEQAREDRLVERICERASRDSKGSNAGGVAMVKVLVVRDSNTKSVFAHVVPSKGVSEDRMRLICWLLT